MNTFRKHRFESSETHLRRIAQTLIPVHNLDFAGSAVGADDGCLDSEHLTFKATLRPCLCRLALRDEPEGVGIRTADRILLGDALGRTELVRGVPGKFTRERPARTVDDVGPQAHPAHGLDATRDSDVHGTARYETGSEVIGLLRRTALAIDGGGGNLVWKALAEPGRAGDVERLLTHLGDASPKDLLNFGGIETGPLDQLDLRCAEQLGGVHSRQRPVALADGGPHCLDDDGLCHIHFLWRSLYPRPDECRARQYRDSTLVTPEGEGREKEIAGTTRSIHPYTTRIAPRSDAAARYGCSRAVGSFVSPRLGARANAMTDSRLA